MSRFVHTATGIEVFYDMQAAPTAQAAGDVGALWLVRGSGLAYRKTAATTWVQLASFPPGNTPVTVSGTLNDNNIARWDGATQALQSSTIDLDDSGNLTGVGTISATDTLTLAGTAAQSARIVLGEDADNGVLTVTLAAPAQVATSAKTATLIDVTGSVPVFPTVPDAADLFITSSDTAGGIKKSAAGYGDATITALGAANTDHEMFIGPNEFMADVLSTTWLQSYVTAQTFSLQRFASTDIDGIAAPIGRFARSTASKGMMITSVTAYYSVTTAAMADVQIRLRKTVLPADNATYPVSPTVTGGDSNAHYAADHDTAVKRGAVGGGTRYHASLMTPPSPAYIASGEVWDLEFYVDGTATGTSDLYFYGCLVKFTAALTDLT